MADYLSVVDEATQFVDVRQRDEVAASSIPGATNIPLGELPSRLGELDAHRRVVLLCRSGGRSTSAAQLLTSHGFSDVVNLAGGMLAYEPSTHHDERLDQ